MSSSSSSNSKDNNNSKPAKPDKESKKYLYELLGIESTATPSQIKTAYRRLALQLHPDKNPGDEEAAERFKEISQAFAILSDPNKRHRYDIGEVDTAEVDSLDIESLGVRAKMVLSVLSKLGINMPTAVTPKVLAEAQECCLSSSTTLVQRTALKLDAPPIERRVSNQRADFFVLTLTERQVQAGICVQATSSSSCRFKLLHFDRTGQLVHQEESCSGTWPNPANRNGKPISGTKSAMFFTPFEAFTHDRSVLSQAFAKFDNDVPPVFRQLDCFSPSRYSRLDEGDHLFAVFGDNFFSMCKYNIQVTSCCAEVVPDVQAKERQLAERKNALSELESEYQQARERYERARERVEEETRIVDQMLKEREDLYNKYRSGNTTEPTSS